ncbi:MAG: hypothetical protein AAFX81_17010 [Pseudomonadota bacterium]
MRPSPSPNDDGLLIETTRVGDWQRVAVLCPADGRESVVHGPIGAATEALVRLAVRRLAARDRTAARTTSEPDQGIWA